MRPDGIALRPLAEADLEAVHGLSAAASWPHRLADWRMLHALGSGVVACADDGAIVGCAMAWRHGAEAATLGMVLVTPAQQGRGIGRRMMDALLAELGGRRLMLNATEAGLRLYDALGFRSVGLIRQQQGLWQPPSAPSSAAARARPLRAVDLLAITALDAAAFGAARPALLDRLWRDGTGAVLDGEEDGPVRGFAFRRTFGRGHVIGPLVARDEDDAIALVAALAEPGFLRLDIPAEATRLSAFLAERGLPATGGVTTMARGPWPPPSPSARRFALISQALG